MLLFSAMCVHTFSLLLRQLSDSSDELRQKEGSKLAGKQEYAKRVAMDLYHFM